MFRVATLISLTLAVTAPATDKSRDEVLKLVPDDAAFCVVVRNVREQVAAVTGSPFAEWAATKFGGKVTDSAEFRTLKGMQELFAKQLGVSFEDLRDDVFGDLIVFAYIPGPPNNPEAERGIVFIKPRQVEKLTALLDKLNDFQRASGEIVAVETATRNGIEYRRRKAKAGGKDECYVIRDGVFAFSAQESAFSTVLDRMAKPPAESPIAASLDRLGVGSSLITFWVNPRKLDAEVAADIEKEVDAGKKAFARQFAAVWSATDSLAATLTVNKGVELGLAMSFNPERLPTDVRPLLEKPIRSAFWDSVPANAILAVGGRINLETFLPTLASFLPPDERTKLFTGLAESIGPVIGKPKVKPFLTAVGPEWGFWVEPPRPDSKSWFPEITVLVKLTGDESMTRAAAQLAGFWMQMIQVEYNRKHDDQIESNEEQGVKHLTNTTAFPPGFAPGFQVKNGHLIVGSSPAVVHRFQAPTKSTASADIPLARLSAVALRSYLTDHRRGLSDWLAKSHGKSSAEIDANIGTLIDLLEPFDRVELLVRGDGKTFGLTLRVTTTKSLAK